MFSVILTLARDSITDCIFSSLDSSYYEILSSTDSVSGSVAEDDTVSVIVVSDKSYETSSGSSGFVGSDEFYETS